MVPNLWSVDWCQSISNVFSMSIIVLIPVVSIVFFLMVFIWIIKLLQSLCIMWNIALHGIVLLDFKLLKNIMCWGYVHLLYLWMYFMCILTTICNCESVLGSMPMVHNFFHLLVWSMALKRLGTTKIGEYMCEGGTSWGKGLK